MKNITLIGCGCGSLTAEGSAALRRAELLIGSGRLLSEYAKEKLAVEAVTAAAIGKAISQTDREEICVLFSGDSGFYSGAKQLVSLLEGEPALSLRLLPGISSLQAFAARLGVPWQDWKLCSAHGTECDAVAAVCGGSPVFFLTGGKQGPAELCGELTDAGLGFLNVTVGEDLGSANEKIVSGTAENLAGDQFTPLSVLLAEPAPRPLPRVPGIADGEFVRAEGIPMTKREVRAAALSRLGIRTDDVCWDIGAGTGSVSVELALQAKRVYAVEQNGEALVPAEENRKKFGAWNLKLIRGKAPEALKDLPRPDAVFIGGSGGELREILQSVFSANRQARVCISAVTLETLHEAAENLKRICGGAEIIQLSVSSSRKAGNLTMMLAQNPVWLICGNTT